MLSCEAIRQAFDVLDSGNGFIEASEFCEIMMGSNDAMTEFEVLDLLNELGVEPDGRIHVDQFVNMCASNTADLQHFSEFF